jgi:hypothetical protein
LGAKEKRGDELAVGDMVMVADGEYEEILEFAHAKISFHRKKYVEIVMESGHSVRATKNHRTDRWKRGDGEMHWMKFDEVEIGDELEVVGLGWTKVTKVREWEGAGVINPVVRSAKVVVDGVVVSTLATPWCLSTYFLGKWTPTLIVKWAVQLFIH